MSLLTELLQGYRRPAVAITDNGSIVCSSPAATPSRSMQANCAGEPLRSRMSRLFAARDSAVNALSEEQGV
jgi:hypothetical protein